MIKAISAIGITAGHEDVDEEIRRAFGALALERDAPLTQASLGEAQAWISLENDEEVRLA